VAELIGVGGGKKKNWRKRSRNGNVKGLIKKEKAKSGHKKANTKSGYLAEGKTESQYLAEEEKAKDKKD